MCSKKTPKFGESDNKASKRFGVERNETNRSPVVAAVANAMWNKRTKKQIKHPDQISFFLLFFIPFFFNADYATQ